MSLRATATQSLKFGGPAAALVAIGLIWMSGSPTRVRAQDRVNDEGSLIQRGYEIAPVPLNLAGKNRALVGLGSFLVNAVADCNGCHTSGGPPNFNYAAGGNPYFGQHQVVDPTVYLSGGGDFPPVGTPTGPSGYVGPDMISRNLTPDKTGRPAGGMTLAEFKQILRTGRDVDHLHPTCTSEQLTAIEGGATPICIPTSPDNPVDGSLLQIMPWPTFSNMTDHQLDAIYEYLSAIPCIGGPATPSDLPPPLQYAYPELHHDCH